MRIFPINPAMNVGQNQQSGVLCCACKPESRTRRDARWADLDGEPFKAFYCNECSLAAQQIERIHNDGFPVGGGKITIWGPTEGVVRQAAHEECEAIDRYRSPTYRMMIHGQGETRRYKAEVTYYGLD